MHYILKFTLQKWCRNGTIWVIWCKTATPILLFPKLQNLDFCMQNRVFYIHGEDVETRCQ